MTPDLRALAARLIRLEAQVAQLTKAGAGEPAYLDSRAAARYLGLTFGTLQYYAYRLRLIPFVKRGRGRGHVVYRREDLDAFMEQRAAEGKRRRLRAVEGGGA